MHRSALETVVGAAVLLVAVVFLAYVLGTARPTEDRPYVVNARFLQIGGLEPGSDVRINGIKVGTVIGRGLDPKTYEAVVRLSLTAGVRIPADTEVAIAGDGLLGDKYIRLIPGSAAETLKSGGILAKTRDYKSLEDTVAEIIYLATGAN